MLDLFATFGGKTTVLSEEVAVKYLPKVSGISYEISKGAPTPWIAYLRSLNYLLHFVRDMYC